MTALTLRAMTGADLRRALDWAAAEGWNPGLADDVCFATVDPEGMLVASVDDTPVGSITVVNYDDAFAFLGFYIVRPEYRGRGYGLALWEAGMSHAGRRRVGLDGVPAQQANYRRSGFVYAWRNLRFTGEVRADPPATGLVTLDRGALDAVGALDRRVFPAARRRFLDSWLSADGHVALGHVADGGLTGFAVLRPCRAGAKIGPLVAPDRAAAEALFDGLVARWGGGTVVLDVPDVNPAAVALAEDRGFSPIFETARMYTGPAPAMDTHRLFGVTSFELG
ncbi:MAG: GNAT family N-acetyltransferase [Alphaproteobacteria bacterium]|jgi:ribosomal protein S18 acetylase RimI-like enzyme|nr:GNAT family N-acetyltransferase [Alphaproteobacteria bacterium]